MLSWSVRLKSWSLVRRFDFPEMAHLPGGWRGGRWAGVVTSHARLAGLAEQLFAGVQGGAAGDGFPAAATSRCGSMTGEPGRAQIRACAHWCQHVPACLPTHTKVLLWPSPAASQVLPAHLMYLRKSWKCKSRLP